MPTCTVKFFAQARDLAGAAEISFEFEEGARIDALKEHLIESYPELAKLLGHCSFAIDREYAPAAAELVDGAEIACIPPVSGG